MVLFSRRKRGRPDLAWVTSHLPINLLAALSEVIIRNVLRATAAGGNTHGHGHRFRGGGISLESALFLSEVVME